MTRPGASVTDASGRERFDINAVRNHLLHSSLATASRITSLFALACHQHQIGAPTPGDF